MAHFATRGLMHEAAIMGEVDPDRLSFTHAVRVIRRKMTQVASLPPLGTSPHSTQGYCGNSLRNW